MGLTVSRQNAKHLSVKKGKFYSQPSKKAVVIRRETVSRSFKSHYFSYSSRTAGIFLTGTTSFHVPKYTQFTVFSTHLPLNFHYNGLLSGSTSGFKISMINCIDKKKKVNINFNSWGKSPLDNHQPSKALRFNRQPSNRAKFNRQPSKLHLHSDLPQCVVD